MPKIITIEKLTASHIACEIEAPDVASAVRPGQVVHVRLGDAELFEPYAVADFDPEKGTITIVTTSVGHHATPWRSAEAVPEGDLLPPVEVTGPAGRPSERRGTKVVLASERAGVCAVLPILREYKREGTYTIVIAGYETKDATFWVDRVEPLCNELYVVTEDGSYGIKGPVRHTFVAVCENVADIDHAVAVGSLKMMKACTQVAGKHGIPIRLTLSSIVQDESSDEIEKRRLAEAISRFGWDNATDVNGHEVDFDDLTQKLGVQLTK